MSAKKIKNRKKNPRLMFLLMVAILIFAVFAVMISPLFEIRHIDISGNAAISDADVLVAAQINTGQNIFSFSVRGLARRVSAMPFAGDVRVSRSLPNGVTINVTERVAVANIRVANVGAYLLIDDAGMVLDAGNRRVHLPVITGISPTSFAVGEYLATDSAVIFDSILSLSRVFGWHDFLPDAVDLSNLSDIMLQVGSLDVFFGSIEDADRKVQYLQAILAQFPISERGYIYIRDVNIRPRFGLIR